MLQYVVLIYLSIQILYLFIFSLAGVLVKKERYPTAANLRRIKILIPAYKEDDVIISTVKVALQHDYPQHLFDVLVIADSFKQATLDILKKLPIKLIQVNFLKSTKGKALFEGIKASSIAPGEVIVIIDADNHMAHGFLHAVNNCFEAGYEVVQGHRTAKNCYTPIAFLDACSEEINNHIFRRGHVALGMPSALIGSGMAFKYEVLISILQDIGETTGEDKEFEFRLARLKKQIAFLSGRFIYDEKVSNRMVFSNQRNRWVNNQFEFFKKYFFEGFVQLSKGNISFANKVFQMFLLQRIVLICVTCVWMLWLILFSSRFEWLSIAIFILLITALLMGIPNRWYNKQMLKALLYLPFALLSIVKAIMRLANTKQRYMPTSHYETEVKRL